MKNTDIKDIKYLNENVTALYYGSTLVWKREEDDGEYKPVNTFSGKFTDTSTSKDWTIKLRYSKSTVKPSIAQYVNPETKIFDFDIDAFADDWGTSLMRYLHLCSDLTELEYIYRVPNGNENGLSFSSMFSGCSNLLKINCKGWSSEGVTSIYEVFSNSPKLTTLYNLNWDLGSVDSTKEFWPTVDAFYKCESLENVSGVISNLKENLSLKQSPLTVESAMVFINGVVDVEATRTLTFSTSTFEQLSEEQIAVATSKGWTVAK